MDDKVEADNPQRCEHTTNNRQCDNRAEQNSRFCSRHSNLQRYHAERISVRGYMLAKWMVRAADHADFAGIKDLKAEIGILRMLLETRLNKCKDEYDLAINANNLSDLIMKIQKLVQSAFKLDMHLGKTMDETQIMQIADSIVDVITRVVPDEELRRTLAQEIGDVIARQIPEPGSERGQA